MKKMTMTTNSHKYLKICKKCRHRINSYGGPVFELFCFIYVNQSRDNLVFFDDSDGDTKKYLIPVVKFLEKKRIVLSCELHQWQSLIKLHVVEKYVEENGAKYLCWCGDN